LIYAVEITKGATNSYKNKQANFFLFGEHPRELISPEIGINLVNLLCGLEYQNKIDLDTFLLDHQFSIIINANPGGRTEVEVGNTCKRTNLNNVNLNRNWDSYWTKVY
jgi:hypothetical protein